MNKVVDIRSRMPHMTGDAVCLQCRYSWLAVAEIGVLYLECPACHLEKGVFKAVAVPDIAYQCNCGCWNFYITETGAICSLCGLTHDQF